MSGRYSGSPPLRHENRIREAGNLVDDVDCALGRKIGRRTQLSCGRATVDTAQIAALGDFPEDKPRFELLKTSVFCWLVQFVTSIS